jgi:multiple sugar transport system substrate-binding protein
MMMVRKLMRTLIYISLTLLVLASGCGSPAATIPAPAAQNSEVLIADGKAVTIKVFQSSAGITDEDFIQNFVEPVKRKFPNVTMELVRNGKGSTKEDLISTGQFPDIILTTSWDLTPFLDVGLLTDLNESIRQTKFDLTQYEKNTIDSIKLYSEKEELFALPYSFNFELLYYNKAIFDKAGLPYPKDGMTWEEVVELGRKLVTVNPNIRAIDPNGLRWVAQSFLVPFADPKTEKAIVDTEDWKYLFQLFKSIEDIPDDKKTKKGVAGFEQDQTVAMYASSGGRIGEIEELLHQGVKLDWDMVSFPLRKGHPSKEVSTQAHVLAVSSTSKNKEDAFRIISYLTTDKDIQTRLAQRGALPAIKDPEIKAQFGESFKTLEGRNVQAIFKNVYGTMGRPTRYDALVMTAVQDALNKMIRENLDANTTIRIAQEAADKAIQSEKGRK